MRKQIEISYMELENFRKYIQSLIEKFFAENTNAFSELKIYQQAIGKLALLTHEDMLRRTLEFMNGLLEQSEISTNALLFQVVFHFKTTIVELIKRFQQFHKQYFLVEPDIFINVSTLEEQKNLVMHPLVFESKLMAVAGKLLPTEEQNLRVNRVALTENVLFIEFSSSDYVKKLTNELKSYGFIDVAVVNEFLLKLPSVSQIIRFFVEICRFNFEEFKKFFEQSGIQLDGEIKFSNVSFETVPLPTIGSIETHENGLTQDGTLFLKCPSLNQYSKQDSFIYLENLITYLNCLYPQYVLWSASNHEETERFLEITKGDNTKFNKVEIQKLLFELNGLGLIAPSTSVAEILADWELQQFNQQWLSSNDNNFTVGNSS